METLKIIKKKYGMIDFAIIETSSKGITVGTKKDFSKVWDCMWEEIYKAVK